MPDRSRLTDILLITLVLAVTATLLLREGFYGGAAARVAMVVLMAAGLAYSWRAFGEAPANVKIFGYVGLAAIIYLAVVSLVDLAGGQMLVGLVTLAVTAFLGMMWYGLIFRKLLAPPETGD